MVDCLRRQVVSAAVAGGPAGLRSFRYDSEVSDAAAWTADGIAVLALGISVVALVRGEARKKRGDILHSTMGPSKDIRETVGRARTCFIEVISLGGRERSYFLAEDRKTIGREIRDLIGQVKDDELRDLFVQIAMAWDYAAANSPSQHRPDDVDHAARRTEELEQAELGEAACESALTRLNELEYP